jgi:hypothetical protein
MPTIAGVIPRETDSGTIAAATTPIARHEPRARWPLACSVRRATSMMMMPMPVITVPCSGIAAERSKAPSEISPAPQAAPKTATTATHWA